MVVVRRLFEVLRARMVKTIEKQGKAAQWMLEQALRLGRVRYERGRLPLHEKPLDLLLERTFRTKVRNRFGGRLKAMVSGGAPLNRGVRSEERRGGNEWVSTFRYWGSPYH